MWFFFALFELAELDGNTLVWPAILAVVSRAIATNLKTEDEM